MSRRTLPLLAEHLHELHACQRCPDMIGPVVTGHPVASPVFFAGQAPGPHEAKFDRPFAWTAGKTLFKWTASIGLDEARFRERVYLSAICRCFPGKTKQGGDRVPSPAEVASCAPYIDRELTLLAPRLVVPVGRLAIEAFLSGGLRRDPLLLRRGPSLGRRSRPSLPAAPLADTIGKVHRGERAGVEFDLIPLPHPSGASTWWKMAPGAGLLARALELIECHPAWRQVVAAAPPARPSWRQA